MCTKWWIIYKEIIKVSKLIFGYTTTCNDVFQLCIYICRFQLLYSLSAAHLDYAGKHDSLKRYC